MPMTQLLSDSRGVAMDAYWVWPAGCAVVRPACLTTGLEAARSTPGAWRLIVFCRAPPARRSSAATKRYIMLGGLVTSAEKLSRRYLLRRGMAGSGSVRAQRQVRERNDGRAAI